MPPSDSDEEAEVQGWPLTETVRKRREENAKLKAFMASEDYQLACQAAVRASRLEFKLKEGSMTNFSSSHGAPFE